MIWAWLLDVARGFIGWVLDLFPSDWELPDWFTGLADTAAEVIGNAAGLGAWVPWGIVLTVVGATFVLWTVGLIIKFVRWVVGLIPTMGGG